MPANETFRNRLPSITDARADSSAFQNPAPLSRRAFLQIAAISIEAKTSLPGLAGLIEIDCSQKAGFVDSFAEAECRKDRRGEDWMQRYWGVALLAVVASASAQLPPQTDEDRAREAAAMAAYNAKPDTQGRGAFPALKEEDPSLPEHTVYRPTDLDRVAPRQLGIVAWGNGACSKDGASARFHLSEIASHGYVVIAPGSMLTGPGAKPRPPAPQGPLTPDGYSSIEQVRQGIDWAIAQNTDANSPYYGKIDPAKVAVSGFSCGGIQALKLASDPRVKAIVVHNSGLLPDGSPPMAFITTTKALLDTLRTPVIYIQGGPTDIAYENGKDDFQRITKVPAFMLNQNTGHGGTFLEENGGRAATAAVAWLNWQLRGDPAAARMFIGEDCGLCTDPAWTVERKNLP